MASVDDIAQALLAQSQPVTPAMGAIMAARQQLATQPQRLGPPDIGEAPIGDGGQISAGTAVGNRMADIASQVPGHMLGSLASLPQRAIEAAGADYANRGDYSPDRPLYSAGPAVETALGTMGTGAIAGVPVRAGETILGAGPIRAYHGSPHDFDAFSMDKIGTGEGAQAYGHGLYFADNEKVAEGYRNTLADWKVNGAPADPADPSHIAAVTLKAYDGDPSKAIADLTGTTKVGPQSERDVASKAINLIQSGTTLPKATGGHMYEVNINADPEHFLDFDKPLNKQAPEVQDALKKAMGSGWDDYKYADASSAVRKGLIAFRDETVAKKLNEAGIPGIKYLDQGSRAAGEGSRNYVVFDDKLIDIARKYGMGSLAALPPAALAALSNSNEQNQ